MAEIASKCSKVSKQFNIEIASINERIESSAKSGHFEIDYYVADVLDVNMRELNDKIIKSLEDDGFVVKPSDIERYGFNLQISWRPEEIT
jgi:hypothetical protein